MKLLSVCPISFSRFCQLNFPAIQTETGLDEKQVEAWVLDLESFASVKEFVQQFNSSGYGRLDLLILSAAIVTMKYDTTDDGWEKGQVTLCRSGISSDPSNLVVFKSIISHRVC